jgi:uncharacterized protein YbaP (TraB family)
MAKQPIILVGIVLLTLLVVYAFSKKKRPKENLLWEITSAKTKKKSYLFGTIHLIEKEFFKLPEELKNKILSSEQVLFEIPYPNNIDLKKWMLLPENENLFSQFTEVEKSKIFSWAQSHLKMNPDEFQENYKQFKPFVLAQTITQASFLDNTVSYEQEIFKIIKNQNIKIVGLESVEEQLNILNQQPIEKQKNYILQAIDSFEVNTKTLKEIQLAYKSQDLQKIAEWINKEKSTFDFLTSDLLDNRNIKWLAKIIENVDNSSSFIAVGAGHLSGENGLIQLLKNKGYKVKSIYLK